MGPFIISVVLGLDSVNFIVLVMHWPVLLTPMNFRPQCLKRHLLWSQQDKQRPRHVTNFLQAFSLLVHSNCYYILTFGVFFFEQRLWVTLFLKSPSLRESLFFFYYFPTIFRLLFIKKNEQRWNPFSSRALAKSRFCTIGTYGLPKFDNCYITFSIGMFMF